MKRSWSRVSALSNTLSATPPSVNSGSDEADRPASSTSSRRSKALAAPNFKPWSLDYFDVVIVDEFHHAAAPSYERLLTRLRPRQLLGMTATPERADGLDVLRYFGGRIAAELRVWDAIDQQYLVPFSYFGDPRRV